MPQGYRTDVVVDGETAEYVAVSHQAVSPKTGFDVMRDIDGPRKLRERQAAGFELAKLARGVGPRVIEVLGKIVEDEKAPHQARVNAGVVLLDRGYGKVPQTEEAAGDNREMHLAALRAVSEGAMAGLARGAAHGLGELAESARQTLLARREHRQAKVIEGKASKPKGSKAQQAKTTKPVGEGGISTKAPGSKSAETPSAAASPRRARRLREAAAAAPGDTGLVVGMLRQAGDEED